MFQRRFEGKGAFSMRKIRRFTASITPKWIRIIRRLELLLKRIITVNDRANFFCDSHPRFCYHCIYLRYVLHFGKRPKGQIYVDTKKGRFLFL